VDVQLQKRHVAARTILGATLVWAGCGGGMAPSSYVSGRWAESFSIPGASLVLMLNQMGNGITGNGNYSIEAGRAGTLQVTGTYESPTLNLMLTYDYGETATFTGTLVDSQHLSGTWSQSGSPAEAVTFNRQ
jgi:hypothetical protein